MSARPPLLARCAAVLLSCAGLWVCARAGFTLMGSYRYGGDPPPREQLLVAQLVAGALTLALGIVFYARSGLLQEDLDQLSPRCDEPAPQRELKRANALLIGLCLAGIVAAVACFAWG